MTDYSQWLPKLCELGDGTSQFAWARTPFHVTSGDQRWTMATNGRTLVAIAGALPGYELGPDEAHRTAAPFLSPVASWFEVIPLNLLRSWCGPAEYARRCGCDNGCSLCDYEGRIIPKARPASLLGRAVGCEWLACILQGLDGETLRLAWKGRAGIFPGPFIFEPDQPLPTGQAPWRVAIMPMLLPFEEADHVRVIGSGDVQASWLHWNDHTVLKLARAIQEERAFDRRLPILADALEEAGCNREDILAHCRRVAPHPCGCWVIDLLTGNK